MRRFLEAVDRFFVLIEVCFNWLMGLPGHYRDFKLKAFQHMATAGLSRRQRAVLFHGKSPQEVYDTYFLSLVPKTENLPLLRFEPVADEFDWMVYTSEQNKKGTTDISRWDLKQFRFVLVHCLYNRTYHYKGWLAPLIVRYSGYAKLRLLCFFWIERPILWAFRRLLVSVNDRFNQPEIDRYEYLKACINLGQNGEKFNSYAVFKKVYGTTAFTTGQSSQRKNLTLLVLESLVLDNAVSVHGGWYRLTGKALQLYQSMTESREKRYDEASHNSQMRILTTVLAIGVVAEIFQAISPFIPRVIEKYRSSAIGDDVPLRVALYVLLASTLLLSIWYKRSLRKQRKSKIKI